VSLRIAAVSLLLFAAACTPKPGDSCSIDKNVCADGHTMLACNTGQYVKVDCPGGCADPGNGSPHCNFAGAPAGGACAGADHGKQYCAPDKQSRTLCLNAHLVNEPCRGLGRCADLDQGGTVCDQERAKIDDYCSPRTEGSYACEAEGNNQLVCKGGKFILSQPCSECAVQDHKAVCTKILGR
jgi:hypothetical protein